MEHSHPPTENRYMKYHVSCLYMYAQNTASHILHCIIHVCVLYIIIICVIINEYSWYDSTVCTYITINCY